MRCMGRVWLSAFVVAVLFGGSQALASRVTEGLLHLYTFDEGLGTDADDSAGSNPAVLHNMDPATDWVSARPARLLRL